MSRGDRARVNDSNQPSADPAGSIRVPLAFLSLRREAPPIRLFLQLQRLLRVPTDFATVAFDLASCDVPIAADSLRTQAPFVRLIAKRGRIDANEDGGFLEGHLTKFAYGLQLR
jgi:hypothetical protein